MCVFLCVYACVIMSGTPSWTLSSNMATPWSRRSGSGLNCALSLSDSVDAALCAEAVNWGKEGQ